MKTATARDLRYKTSSILENINKGEDVIITLRGKSVAILKSIKEYKKERGKGFKPIGFGLWKERKDLKNVREWIDERRKSRFQK
jgi:prevent-host-death family protein